MQSEKKSHTDGCQLTCFVQLSLNKEINIIPIKDMILENCKVKNDDLADRVRIRVQGAVGDLSIYQCSMELPKGVKGCLD